MTNSFIIISPFIIIALNYKAKQANPKKTQKPTNKNYKNAHKKTPKNKLLKFCRIEVILIPQEARGKKISRNKKKGNTKGISIDFG